MALANATIYLDMLGHTVIAWIWLWQAVIADRALAGAGQDEQAFYRGKLAACRYVFRYELPRTEPQAALLVDLDTTCHDVAPDWL